MKYFSLLLLGSICILSGCGQDVKEIIEEPVVDITPPKLKELGAVTTPTNDISPHYVFNSTEVGTITYEPAKCISQNTVVKIGSNTIRFDLSPGTYNCKIKVTDAAGNESQVLNVSEFTINETDNVAPVLKVVKVVDAATNDATPDYSFNSSEPGTILASGDCQPANAAVVAGNNTVTFLTMSSQLHNNCSIKVRDPSGNISLPLKIAPFTIDAQPPVLAEITAVPSSGIDSTPQYTFNSSEAGVISYGGDCSSTTTIATTGDNVITFNTLLPEAAGTHANCTIFVTDSFKNVGVLNVSPFTVLIPALLNDTGVTTCGDYANIDAGISEFFSGVYQNNIDCQTGSAGVSATATDGVENDPVPAGQDAVYGRDQKAFAGSLVKSGGGKSGFDFTKLGSSGAALSNQNGVYSEFLGNEFAGTKWSCVKDNVTGLIWEVKTDDGGLRDKDNVYDFNITLPQYINAINAADLCGETSNNWRLPTAEELLSIVDYGSVGPSIDTDYFPNTVSQAYVTSVPYFSSPTIFWVVKFDRGFEFLASSNVSVRLVRSAP